MIILSIKKKNNPRRSPTISITKLHFIRLWLKRITLLPVTTSRQCGLSLGGWSEGLLTGFLSWTLLPATWWLPEHPSTLSSGNQVCQSLEQPKKCLEFVGEILPVDTPGDQQTVFVLKIKDLFYSQMITKSH